MCTYVTVVCRQSPYRLTRTKMDRNFFSRVKNMFSHCAIVCVCVVCVCADSRLFSLCVKMNLLVFRPQKHFGRMNQSKLEVLSHPSLWLL